VSIESSHSTAKRAYRIWEQMGRPEGQALEHWLMAEAELASKPTARPARAEPTARPAKVEPTARPARAEPAPRRGRRKKI
jgi:Protein of unknown function (DUF2934)